MSNSLYGRSKDWHCFEYEIQELQTADQEKRGLFLLPQKRAEIHYYDPLDVPSEPPSQPQGNKLESFKYAPHIHLANVDLADNEEVLSFVNSWGLLGLWHVENFKDGRPTMDPDPSVSPPGQGIFDEGYQEYARCYVYKPYEEDRNVHNLKKHMEPLEQFKAAARGYQELHGHISESKDDWRKTSLIDKWFRLQEIHPKPFFNKEKKQWEFGWDYKALYHAIHLLTYLDLVEGRSYKTCARGKCQRTFQQTRPKQKFCSKNCANAQHKVNQRRRDMETLLHLQGEERKEKLKDVAYAEQVDPEVIEGRLERYKKERENLEDILRGGKTVQEVAREEQSDPAIIENRLDWHRDNTDQKRAGT